ncbi:MAG: phosphoenolpyruvate carboxylase, partial [Verrucomicrobiaceae bacterium]
GSAVFNIELLMASAASTTGLHQTTAAPTDEGSAVLDKLADWSKDKYRSLLHAPGFMTFYRAATPIDALENARIGSRPSRRTGQATLDDLRAIPWVFSWTQSRFYLPGWFGSGTALTKLRDEDPQGFGWLMDALPRNPFLRYVLTNIESSIVSTNEHWMTAYASLVPDEAVRASFLETILAEYHRTKSILTEIFRGTFEARRPRLAFTLDIREQPLSVLHAQQIELLKTWRAHVHAGDTVAAESMISDLLVSVNALASGLRTTG